MSETDLKEKQETAVEIPEDVILDLDEKMKMDVRETIKKAFSEERFPSKICQFIKAKLLEKEEGKWNVILGREFSTYVAHRSRRYGLFKVGEVNVMVWQSGSALL